jgi:hypothetical protein
MEGRWADCADLMSRAESLVHSPTHLLYMARAYAKLGKLVIARETYNRVIREQLPANAPPAFRAAQADAKKELEALKPRVPYISVVVQGAGPLPVIVTMDGVRVPDALVGVPRPVDPGEHRFQARGEGMESNVNTVTVHEGDRETVVLTLKEGGGLKPGEAGEPPEDAPPAEPASAETKPGQEPQPLAPEQPGGADEGVQAEDKGAGLRIGAYAAFGVGAVGLGLGTVFIIQRGSKRSEADDLYSQCAPTCPPATQDEIADLDSSADSAGTLATVGFIVGGVGIASGVTLLLLSSKQAPTESAQAHIEPWIGLGSAGVRGTF